MFHYQIRVRAMARAGSASSAWWPGSLAMFRSSQPVGMRWRQPPVVIRRSRRAHPRGGLCKSWYAVIAGPVGIAVSAVGLTGSNPRRPELPGIRNERPN